MDKKKLHNSEASGNYPEPDVPVEDAWDNMKQLLQHAPAAPAAKSKLAGKGRMLSQVTGAAGVVAVATIVAYFVFNKKETPAPAQVTSYSSDATTRTDTLYDGAIAFLDVESSIAVTKTGDENKQVTLNRGGCYFKQINDSSTSHWQIQAGPVSVFPANANVYVSVDEASAVTVIQVQHGNATVQTGKHKLTLAAGEQVRLNTQQDDAMPTKQKLNPNLISYTNKIFEFSNTPFKEAAAFIEKAYGVKIIVKNNKLDNCTITTRFDNKSLEEILDILGYTLSFEYSIDKNKNQVIISADGCS